MTHRWIILCLGLLASAAAPATAQDAPSPLDTERAIFRALEQG